MSKSNPRTYKNVRIWFLGSDHESAPHGEVIVADDIMTLGFTDNATDYVVEGRVVQNWYEGENKLAAPKATAKWAKSGDVFVGHWTEGGNDYLFSFELR